MDDFDQSHNVSSGNRQPDPPTGQPLKSPGHFNEGDSFEWNSSQQQGPTTFSSQADDPNPPYAASVRGVSKPSPGKIFFISFLGALIACVLAFVGYNVFSNLISGQSGSSGTLSGSTTIQVSGEDATLAEAVAAKTLPSVVNIDVYTSTSTSTYGLFSQQGQSSPNALRRTSLGSGVILSEDGYVLTNNHVVDGSERLVVAANGERYEAKIVGTDPSSDLAVIKMDASGFTPIEIGNSADLVVGEWVMAAGSPFGMEQSVSTGIVSAVNRSYYSSESGALYTNMIQTDAAINSGNSGGALVDAEGKLIGINTLILSSSGTSSGVGFAIPIDYANGIAQQIMDGKSPSHAQLGVTLITVNSSVQQRFGLSVDHGAYINEIRDGSAAQQAGLQVGDVITKVNDTDITSSSGLVLAIRSYAPGDKVNITYNRGGEDHTAEVTLGSDM